MADLRERLARSRLAPPDASGWERGVPGFWLSALLADWQAFDVSRFQARLDRLTHLRASLDGQLVHLVHMPGRGPDPMPLLLTHGWPGSFCEYLDLLPLLTDPQAHGGDPGDAFTVVVPSLPGFGFSAPPPPGGLTHSAVAALWHRLMADGLGYRRYAAHGSDLGAGVTAWLARAHADAVAGIHLATPGLPAPPAPWTPAEQAYFAEAESWAAEEGGYAHQQATKPSTLGAGLYDSPAGLAAWIVEKFRGWSDCDGDIESRFTKDELLTHIMIYWVTESIGSSFLTYYDYANATALTWMKEGVKKWTGSSKVPAAFALFPKDISQPPREWAERFFNVQRWTEMPKGGHFAAMEEPELLANEIRAYFRDLI